MDCKICELQLKMINIYELFYRLKIELVIFKGNNQTYIVVFVLRGIENMVHSSIY